MQVGDDVYVRREGVLPHWFRWQGLPCTIVAIEADGFDISCRMPDGNIVSFAPWELVTTWSGLPGSTLLKGQGVSTLKGAEEQDIATPGRSLDQDEQPSEPWLAPRGRYFYDTRCSICKHAVDEDWFGLPPGLTHCPRQKSDGTWCHATFGGTRLGNPQIHCVKCHRTFSTPRTLEQHKGPGNVCRDPQVMKSKKGQRYFGEPVVNEYGTEIWRRSGEDRPDFRSPDRG